MKTVYLDNSEHWWYRTKFNVKYVYVEMYKWNLVLKIEQKTFYGLTVSNEKKINKKKSNDLYCCDNIIYSTEFAVS